MTKNERNDQEERHYAGKNWRQQRLTGFPYGAAERFQAGTPDRQNDITYWRFLLSSYLNYALISKQLEIQDITPCFSVKEEWMSEL